MRKYIVTRHNSNGANQGMANTMILGIVEASSPSIARARAEKRAKTSPRWNCYANQHLSIKAEGRCSSDDWNAACEADDEARQDDDEAQHPHQA